MYGVNPYGSAPYGSGPLGDPPEPPPSGASLVLPLRVTMVEAQTLSLPLDVRMVEVRTISLALRVTMVEAQTLSLPLRVTMVDPLAGSPANWRPVVTLDGVDISARLTGEIRVQAREGESRIAAFALVPAPGSLVLPDWTGAAVTIDIAQRADDGSPLHPRRLFTGVVDVPEYDVSGNRVSFECTDQRQEVLGNVTRDWVDAQIGGEYSPAVSGEPADTLQYALDRLASVPAALDLDPYQSPRVTEWALPETPDFTFDASHIVDGSLSLRLASRADLRNHTTTRLQYRFPRLRGRVIEARFEHEIDDYTLQGLDIPSRAMIEQALDGLSGWQRLGEINYVAVDPGTYESAGSGGSIYTTVSLTDAPNLALGFAASFASRWVQSVTEDYALTVTSPASVSAIGYARETLDGATLDAQFDDAAWLDDPAALPALTLPTIGDVSLDYGADGSADRASAQAALRALVAQSMVRHKASHRTTEVSGAVAIDGRLDLDLRVMFDTAVVRASGKVVAVDHSMDLQQGAATTVCTIAVSGCAAVGLQTEDDVDAPAEPADPTPAPGAAALACEIGFYVGQVSGAPVFDPDTMIGYSTNARAGLNFDGGAPAYPLQMSVGAPEIESAVRDPLVLTKAAHYVVAIPQDLLEITAP